MNRFYHELNAVVAVAARDVIRYVRVPGGILLSFLWPLILLGLLGGSLAQNLGEGSNFELSQFILYGVVVMMLYQGTMGNVISLIVDRQNNFTQAMFVAPISRYAVILGKIIGGTVTSLFSVVGVFVVGLLMQIPFTLTDVGHILLLTPIICIAGGALGIFFISVINDPQQATQVGTLVMLPQMFLAGLLVPISQSSGILNVLSHLMPMTYVADLMRNIVFAGHQAHADIVLYSPTVDLAVTLVVAALFIIIGTVVFVRNERTR
jgi:ABC-2 type transport system permease protein